MSQDLVPLVQTRRSSDWLVNQLPVGMVDDPEDDFFLNFVRIFQTVATTIVEGVDNLEHIIDVTVAPTPMVRWLGTWLGVDDVDSSLPHDVQRRIVARSSRVLAWRGTRRGLVDFLELISGAPAEVTDTGGVFAEGQAPVVVPTVWIRVASTGWVPEEDFAALVRRELPANVACEIRIGDRRLWPVDGSGPSTTTAALPMIPASTDLVAPGPASTDLVAPGSPASTDLVAPRPPASTDLVAPGPPASTDVVATDPTPPAPAASAGPPEPPPPEPPEPPAVSPPAQEQP